MRKLFASFLILTTVTSCNFSKSVKKDLISGLFTAGDGLSCEDVYLTANDEKITRTSYIYGEEFKVNFNGIEGFVKDNDYVFPGMKLAVLGKTGDTVMQTNDLYGDYPNGLKLPTLLLNSVLTVASPMESNGDYILHINIWDKKGKGKFNAKLNFKIVPNEKIAVEAVNVKYKEFYIFSKERDMVLTGNTIKFNEDTYLIVEGLSGFREENGKVFPGLSLKGTDSAGNVILDYDDLFAEYDKTGMAVADLSGQVLSNFVLTGTEFKNPLHCELTISDKKSDARIKGTVDLVVE